MEIKSFIKRYADFSNGDTHRFRSFDLCYGYFCGEIRSIIASHEQRGASAEEKSKALEPHLEESCVRLWAYLASWGMLRGSSGLLSHNYSVLTPVVRVIYNTPSAFWHIDADNYLNVSYDGLHTNAQLVVAKYEEIESVFNRHNAPGNSVRISPTITLVTKIMLGVFGNVPAFDTNFSAALANAYRDLPRRFNEKLLRLVADFYSSHWSAFDAFQIPVRTFAEDNVDGLYYPKEKLLDQWGFSQGGDDDVQ